jgi:hypothetical protein
MSVTTPVLQTFMRQDFQQLQSFRCLNPLSSDMFQFLISLPDLKSLDVCLQLDLSTWHTSQERSFISSTGLPSLCVLRILNISAFGAQRLLQSVHSSSIRSLRLRGPTDVCSHKQLSDLIQVIGYHASAPSLQDLGLMYSSGECI